MLVFGLLLLMIAIGIIRFGLKMAWSVTKLVYSILLFVFSPFFILLVVFGYITSQLFYIVIVAVAVYCIYQLFVKRS